MGTFDPFLDRTCRLIRNDLSEALMASLDILDVGPVRKVADRYRAAELSSEQKEYISDRLRRYDRALQVIDEHNVEDPFLRALVLWDEKLFFEVHEVLENVWYPATGPYKLVLQAMIRAAGMYVQLDHGNTKGAASMAGKAVAAFRANREYVPNYFDLDVLLAKLNNVDSVPPKLLNSGSAKKRTK